ncbi:fimbrial protein [Raoultella terrigena]|jgi:major type 1 subunit fimbrin (pilin)|uniref:fimbrial protein n=1 Tax=Raoultella terrigena TaxID=577 RepID=UPI000F47F6A6|nr:fimbrial protein [Raoultella terrigena]MCE9901579.1 type 1 fimbrial protein [Raoultella terrigena]MEB7601961.1 type 1 fimbrial protein [Raoultella terrigena]MEB8196380.1 type 1 fimbrial protein [Raoultella terrigena]ROS31844.1 major type 1 subunit fimbrin (pilin) [Raoultella terrigena]
MKKTILAMVITAATAFSAQALATNQAEVTILGEVADSQTSCVVTPTGTLNNGIVKLMTVTTAEATGQSVNTLFKNQKFGFQVKDCAIGGADESNITGLSVKVTGTSSVAPEILDNVADNGAQNIGIGIQKVSNSARIKFDGTAVAEAYTPQQATNLEYLAGYVKVNAANPVTEGPVKGVATFTIDYTI